MTTSIKHSLGNTKNWIRYYWKAIVIALLACAILFGCRAYALTRKPNIFDLDGWIDTIFNVTNAAEYGKLLSVSISSDFKDVYIYGKSTSGFGSYIGTIHNACVGIAVCVICITFFSSLMSMRMVDVTEEMIMRKMILFIASLVFVAYAHIIAANICNIGTSVLSAVSEKYNTEASTGLFGTTSKDASDAVSDSGGAVAKLKDAVHMSINTTKYSKNDVISEGLDSYVDLDLFEEDPSNMFIITRIGHMIMDFGRMISYHVNLLLPAIVSLGSTVVVHFHAIGRALEILLMCAFSPLAFMDMTSLEDFSHSSAFRWLKTLGAVSLQGVIMLGVVIVGGALMSACILDIVNVHATDIDKLLLAPGANQLSLLTILFAEAGMVSRSGQIARSILSAS